MRARSLGAAILAGTLLLAGCSAKTVTVMASPSAVTTTSPTPTTHLVNGTLVLTTASLIWPSSTDCGGYDGFSDLLGGANVVIKDGGGSTVGAGTLDEGTGAKSEGITCTFKWSVPDVQDSDFYTVEIANRKGPTYSRAQMEGTGWKVAMSIG